MGEYQSSQNVDMEGIDVLMDFQYTEALDDLIDAIKKSGLTEKVKIGTDVVSSEFFAADSEMYDFGFKKPKSLPEVKKTTADSIEYDNGWISKYTSVSIEDTFDD